ncbi:MAG TPA: FAD-binding oxidoreductase [Streptosporangiaceae bacterium]|jgi:FAD/FMN-containing dehydrogenase
MTATAVTVTALDGGQAGLTAAQVGQLRSRLTGPVLRPGQDGWPDAVRIWNAMAASEPPALVVQPVSAPDVAAAVGFAREHGLRVSIKGGGHNIAGTAITPGGLVIDMARMRAVTVDPGARLVRAGAGCLLRDVDRATARHGLATVLGFVSEVGVAGLTLGGGLGYLTRRFGWTADNLAEVEIVTADGQVRTASRTRHPELFWAVRGGGGNFGVVTRFTFRLHPVGPDVYGGLIAWPFSRAAEILPAYRELAAAAPRELAVWLNLLRAPAAPFVPRRWHGERVCAMQVCYSGDLAEAGQVLAPVREIGAPVADLLARRPYPQLQSLLDQAEPKGSCYYWKTGYLSQLSDGFLRTWQDLAARCPVPQAQLGLLHLGGALNEHASDDGAVGNRDARFACGVLGMWDQDEPGAAGFPAWIRAAAAQASRFSTGGSYVNFQTADEDDERVRAAYGANYARLAEVKRAYDPGNLFRRNRNIAPAGR